MKKPIPIKLAAGLVMLILLGLASVRAKAMEEKITVAPGKTVTAKEESQISLDAAKVLFHIALAREAIYGGDRDRALEEIKRSLILMDAIKTVLPTVRAKYYIKVAITHLSYEDAEDVIPDLIPIYASLDAIEDLVPVYNTRGHINKAKAHLEEGKKVEARREFEEADEELIDTETDVPLAYTENQVIQAYGYLIKKEPEAANGALKVAENSTRVIGVSIYSPITKTSKILRQSASDYAAGRLEAVRAGLRQAKETLKGVIKTGDAKIREESREFLKDISSVEEQLEKGDKKIASQITSLWKRAESLSERSAEYASARWDEMTARGKTKVNLIEAKLHVAYANIYQDTTGQVDRVEAEIEESESYLKKAADHADAGTKDRLNAIGNELKEVRSDVNNKRPEDIRARYEKIKTELDELIREM
jgi:phage host-nuclease inhibitor protein Gam